MILAAFNLISCEDSLSPSEYPPLPNENPTGGEGEDPLGYWRIWGTIDTPLDWSPNYDTVQIWMSAYGGGMDQLIVPMQFTLILTSQDSKRWSFKTGGDYYYGMDLNPFFIPSPDWWSDPQKGVYRHTYVRGYKWEEFGGGGHFVLADEDTSYNPYNYPYYVEGWKYYQPYGGGYPCDYLYWAWTSVYLDLTD